MAVGYIPGCPHQSLDTAARTRWPRDCHNDVDDFAVRTHTSPSTRPIVPRIPSCRQLLMERRFKRQKCKYIYKERARQKKVKEETKGKNINIKKLCKENKKLRGKERESASDSGFYGNPSLEETVSPDLGDEEEYFHSVHEIHAYEHQHAQ